MTSPNPDAALTFKQKAAREMKEYLIISAYLAFFFCAMVAYTDLLLEQHNVNDDLVTYSFAIINALIIGKVILIGEMVHVAKHAETRPLYQSVILKSIIFGILVFLFHLLEEFIKRLIHGEPRGTVLHNIHINQLISRNIIIFCAFLPLFAFRELRRVMGEENLYAIFFGRHTPTSKATLSNAESRQ